MIIAGAFAAVLLVPAWTVLEERIEMNEAIDTLAYASETSTAVNIPPIDVAAPRLTETATFALG